jgi:deoxyribodipyrimidine photo-lyase
MRSPDVAYQASRALSQTNILPCTSVRGQSGTTGINAIRIYDPVKQGDHDPTGDFVRRWVPELHMIPGKLVHEPWKLTPLEQRDYQFRPGTTYPERIVDHQSAVRAARETLTAFRRRTEAKRAASDTLRKHGSRASRNHRVRTSKRSPKSTQDNQLTLFASLDEPSD